MKLKDILNEMVDIAPIDGEIKRLNASQDPDERNLSRLLVQKKSLMQQEDQLRKRIQMKRDKPNIDANNNAIQPNSAQPPFSGTYPS